MESPSDLGLSEVDSQLLLELGRHITVCLNTLNNICAVQRCEQLTPT